MDTLAQYVKKVARKSPGVMPDKFGKRVPIFIVLLADDQGYAAAGKGIVGALEERVEASTT